MMSPAACLEELPDRDAPCRHPGETGLAARPAGSCKLARARARRRFGYRAWRGGECQDSLSPFSSISERSPLSFARRARRSCQAPAPMPAMSVNTASRKITLGLDMGNLGSGECKGATDWQRPPDQTCPDCSSAGPRVCWQRIGPGPWHAAVSGHRRRRALELDKSWTQNALPGVAQNQWAACAVRGAGGLQVDRRFPSPVFSGIIRRRCRPASPALHRHSRGLA